MLFTSPQYILFLSCIFFLYWRCPHRKRWILLLAASYLFYASYMAVYAVFLLLATISSFFLAQWIGRAGKTSGRKAMFAGSTVLFLGVLFVFKYLNFFLKSIDVLFGFTTATTEISLLLPVGISFYLFQIIGYLADVYRGKISAETDFRYYALFTAFFPQLLSGPIPRYGALMPQLKEEHTFACEDALTGLRILLWGYFKKAVIADNFAVYADAVFSNVTIYHGFSLVLAALFYSIQIYCDFSGYSDIAIGSARLFGIRLGENFLSPYFSTSVKEFWSRWHISLSGWFRDYVYIPLGGNRRGKIREYANLLATFLISGLWHGANYTFLIWGGIHGLAQVMEKGFGHGKRVPRSRVSAGLQTGVVFLFATVAWVFFRADTLGDAVYLISHLFDGIQNPLHYINAGLVDIGMGRKLLVGWTILFLIPLGIYDYCQAKVKENLAEVISRKGIAFQLVFYVFVGLSILFFTPKGVPAEFVYFQF